ncbi:phosphatase PAP2 family protein [Streptomyces sp. BG9H]|uniref:Phosphatase PAP2 family protein n=1 Tax=Streptomyces anatolicus TaxID=2675858 RepID=A0ABS6YHN7_9ACTN|nr:phosphatase PAP2 family protein [Streptomyces anatolicus]MBW5420917.1 phosphatase PAP2 family protein [Streptomyces anatolicus]
MYDVDHRLLSALRDCGTDPRVASAARALSWSGEHGALWIAAGLVGAAADRERRGAWLRGTALTAAATVAYGALRPAGARLVPPLAAAMCVSRLVVGVHYPSDVAAGAALGALTARVGAAWMNGSRSDA